MTKIPADTWDQCFRPFVGAAVRLCLLILIALWPSTLLAGSELNSEIPTPAQVFRAWDRLQGEIKTARIRWSERITVTEAGFQAFQKLRELEGARGKKGGAMEPSVTTGPLTRKEAHYLLLHGDDWRWNSDGFAMKGSTLIPQREEAVLKGDVAKSYLPAGGILYPTGNISRARESAKMPLAISVRPIFMWLRSSSLRAFDPDAYVRGNDFGVIENHKCLILTSREANKWELWVDIDTPVFLLRRAVLESPSGHTQIEFSYRQGPKSMAPQLNGWHIAQGSNDTLRESITAAISEVDLNQLIPEAEFDLTFPPGTRVRDFTRPSELGDRTEYIVKEDGAVRIITKGEVRAPYTELLTTGSGQATHGHGPWLASPPFLVANGLIFVCLLCWVLVRFVWGRRVSQDT